MLRDRAAPGRVALALGLLAAAPAVRAQSPPPAPARHFNDYARLVPAAEAARLDEKLRRFDQESSSQVVVAIFPELPSPSLEDFTVRTAEAWRVGRKELDNGVVLFVFVKDRAVRLEVGYGLEGALPDATANRIIQDVIVPRFRANDFTGGLEAGIDAILAATRGEYRAPERRVRAPRIDPFWIFVAFVLFTLLMRRLSRAGGASYSRRGRHRYPRYGGPWWGGGFGGGGWSGGSGGGGWSGGGGFSGGGGSFGGGGASGRW